MTDALLTQYCAERCSQVRGIDEGRDSTFISPGPLFLGQDPRLFLRLG
jgi:hypothetical protein